MTGSVKVADLLNQDLRSVLGCILMASSGVMSKDIAVCLSALPPSQQDHKWHPVCKVVWSHPSTPEPRADFEVTLDVQRVCFHVWLMLARCTDVVCILKALILSKLL